MTITLSATNSQGYASPVGITVDPVIMTVRDNALMFLMIKRKDDVEKGKLALPGGFIGADESAKNTAIRKLYEKTNVNLSHTHIEQLETFTDPHRDPRGWIPSIAYIALLPHMSLPDNSVGIWLKSKNLIREKNHIAFDHYGIINKALERIQGKLWFSNIARGFLDENFTLREAREVYEAISGKEYNPSNFNRDLKASGLIKPAYGKKKKSSNTSGRPASFYSFTSKQLEWK